MDKQLKNTDSLYCYLLSLPTIYNSCASRINESMEMILYGNMVHNEEVTYYFRNLSKGEQKAWSKRSTTTEIFFLSIISSFVLAHMCSVRFVSMAYVYEVTGSRLFMRNMEQGYSGVAKPGGLPHINWNVGLSVSS